jgi:hypothetical protein
MNPTDNYRIAPTWLHRKGEARLFKTQEEVDKAWGEGWFGPPWLNNDDLLLGSKDFEDEFRTKAGLVRAVKEDPRYAGLELNPRNTVEDLMSDVIAHEIVVGLRAGGEDADADSDAGEEE